MFNRGRVFLLLMFLLLMKAGNAQTGKLKYTLDTEDYSEDNIEAALYIADTVLGGTSHLIGTKIFTLTDSSLIPEFTFDSLTPGYYSISLLVNHVQRFNHTNIEIKAGKTAEIYQMCSLEYTDNVPEDSASHMDISTQFFYGGREFADKTGSPVYAAYTLSMIYNPYFAIGRHTAFGALIGPSATYATFKKDSVPGKKFERYFGADLNLGLFLRLNSGNGNRASFTGFIFDAGAYYSLPLLFRHAYSIDNTRTQDRWIHQYTNFSAFARIGYKPVSFQLEYRLSDYILGNYPELPKFRIGIALLFNAF